MLELAMRQVKARERLEDPDYVIRLNMVGIEELMVEAGYSDEVVQQVVMEHGWRRLDAGLKL